MTRADPRRSPLAVTLCVVYLVGLVALILFKLRFPPPVLEHRILNLTPFPGLSDGWPHFLWSETRDNLLVFVPLGLFVAMLAPAWPAIVRVLTPVALSLALETAQYIFAIGRADVTDVICNALGGVAGLALYWLASRVLGRRTNTVLTVLLLTLTLAALLLMAWLLATGRWIRLG